jgi:hypothetical protein
MRGQNDLQVRPSKVVSLNPSLSVYPPERVIRVLGKDTGYSRFFFRFEPGTGAHPLILSEPEPRNPTSLADCQKWMKLGHTLQFLQKKSR